MIPGLGLLRRLVTLALVGAAFWAGVQVERSSQRDACHRTGGQWSDQGFCEGGRS